MKFAKYYDVSDLVAEMQKAGEIDCYPTGDDKFEGVYVCMDTTDFWISRINKVYDGKYLVERNKISIYDVMDKLNDLYSTELPYFRENDLQFEIKNKCHNYLKKFNTKDICKAVILLDDYDGLSNWDYCEADSLTDAIDIIDDGYGILPLVD